jgi:NAD(P)-dependent dehydrogenase (short-subunit alcohol dehydrogenase family)
VEGSLKALFEFATKDGKLDHVADTAGYRFGLVKIGDVTAEDIQKYGKVRFVGALLMAKLAPQYMHRTNQSSITPIGGVNSTKPGPGWSVMAGWGSGKEGMARGLAMDLKPIRVNYVSPRAIETELWGSFGGGDKKQQIVDLYKSKTLLGTVGKPEDMVESISVLVCDRHHTFVRQQVCVGVSWELR